MYSANKKIRVALSSASGLDNSWTKLLFDVEVGTKKS